MSANKVTKKKPFKHAERLDSFDFEKLKLMYPVLGACALDRNDPPDELTEEQPDRFYDAVVHLTAHPNSTTLNVGVCEFSAGQKIKGKVVLQIDATYFVAFDLEKRAIQESTRNSLIEEMAVSSAWPLFRDLFIHIGSQSGEELPLLPNVPKVRWLKKTPTKRNRAKSKSD